VVRELPDPDGLIEEQIAFYRANAAGYDTWDTATLAEGGGGEVGRLRRAERASLLAELDRFRPTGRVLEIAAGTGTYTQALAPYADHLTAVDPSPESLAINRAKLGPLGAHVKYLVADVFQWRPTSRYDAVFFAYWLSHVPSRRFDQFWDLVQVALVPGGRVFFIDSAGSAYPTREAMEGGRISGYSEADALAAGVSIRYLDDGQQYHVVKIVWEPPALEQRLHLLGWQATVARTATAIWGTATRALPDARRR
jgi:demethylmenaquinone methyltransferase/2-methoxy-6-polyprenyl-1,4-benzoquinol methylase